jgi:Xaa-Pro aminopeptidase
MAVTIEPGFYVIPEILADSQLTTRFGDQLCMEEIEEWKGLGGIRIEDDVTVTATGHEVLTTAIPKTVADIEDLVGSQDLGPLVAVSGLL